MPGAAGRIVACVQDRVRRAARAAPDATSWHIVLIIAVAAFGGVMEALFSPAVQALIPELVPGNRLAVANSVSQVSRQSLILAGQALGGLLYVAWGAAALLLIDAISFAYGGGALIGSIAAGVVVARVRAVATLVRVCVVGVACCVLMLAATRSASVALAAFVIIGSLLSLINVIVITAFQTAAPSAVRGRVMALVIAVSTAAVPPGMGLGGVLGALWGESLPLVFAGCGVGIAMLVVVVGGPRLPDGKSDRRGAPEWLVGRGGW